MLQAIATHRRAFATGRVRCPYCGFPKARGASMCEGCGARCTRRLNALGWLLVCSIILLPLHLALLRKAPDLVAPKRWRQH